MGPPGSGKGTQADRIRTHYNMLKISSGDVFRALSQDNSELSIKVKSIMDQGKLLPDDLVTEVIVAKLNSLDKSVSYILDGFPRTLVQAKSLDKYLETQGEVIDFVINLELSDDLLFKRISGRITCKSCGASYNKFTNPTKVEGICDSCGSAELIVRGDDNEESIKIRMQEYYKQTQPLLDYYKNRGNLVNINGDQDLDVVTDLITKVLDQHKLAKSLKNST